MRVKVVLPRKAPPVACPQAVEALRKVDEGHCGCVCVGGGGGASADGGATKLLLRLHDGLEVESVIMTYDSRKAAGRERAAGGPAAQRSLTDAQEERALHVAVAPVRDRHNEQQGVGGQQALDPPLLQAGGGIGIERSGVGEGQRSGVVGGCSMPTQMAFPGCSMRLTDHSTHRPVHGGHKGADALGDAGAPAHLRPLLPQVCHDKVQGARQLLPRVAQLLLQGLHDSLGCVYTWGRVWDPAAEARTGEAPSVSERRRRRRRQQEWSTSSPKISDTPTAAPSTAACVFPMLSWLPCLAAEVMDVVRRAVL